MITVAAYVHWAGGGGAEDMVIDEIKYADRSKINYIFVTEEQSGWSVTLDELQALGVNIFRVAEKDGVAFERIYRDNNVDIVHVFSCGDIQLGYRTALEMKLPVVDTVACVAYSKGWEEYGSTGLVHPVYLSQKHWEHGSGGKKEFRIIVGGVDIDKMLSYDLNAEQCKLSWGLDSTRSVVGWFGRFDQFKCPLSFVDIAWFIREREPDCQFIMFGDGYDLGKVKHRALQCGIDIKFPGFTRDKARAFKAMDVYCFPTWQEAFGRVMPEAMSVGTPIVTADYPVCRELCGEAAIYVENVREDPLPKRISQVYVAEIVSLLQNEQSRNLRGAVGKYRAKTLYDAKQMSSEYTQLYEEIVNGRH